MPYVVPLVPCVAALLGALELDPPPFISSCCISNGDLCCFFCSPITPLYVALAAVPACSAPKKEKLLKLPEEGGSVLFPLLPPLLVLVFPKISDHACATTLSYRIGRMIRRFFQDCAFGR